MDRRSDYMDNLAKLELVASLQKMYGGKSGKMEDVSSRFDPYEGTIYSGTKTYDKQEIINTLEHMKAEREKFEKLGTMGEMWAKKYHIAEMVIGIYLDSLMSSDNNTEEKKSSKKCAVTV